MKRLILLLPLSFVLLGASCSLGREDGLSSDKPSEARYWVVYEETACNAFPWERGKQSDAIDPSQVIAVYQQRYALPVLSLEVIDGESDPSCQTCGCKTGRKVQAGVATQEQADFLLASGFSEQGKKSLTETKKEEGKKSSSDTMVNDVLSRRAKKLGTTYKPEAVKTVLSTPSIPTQDKPVVDISDALEDQSLTRHTGEDQKIEEQVKLVQESLWVAFLIDTFYPKRLEDITELDWNNEYLKKVLYTPFEEDGVVKTYELRVEYSDVIEVIHPLPLEEQTLF